MPKFVSKEVSLLFEHGDKSYAACLNGQFPRGLGIQVYRRLLHITQAELAMQLGVSPNCIANWETGRSAVSPERLQDISDLLGVSIHKLQNPSAADIEKASHITTYFGNGVQRTKSHSSHLGFQWPSKLDAFYHRYTEKERAALFSEGTPTSSSWIRFGPNDMFKSRNDGSCLHICRKVTLSDTIALARDDRFSLGLFLKSFRKGNDISEESFFADVCNIYRSIGQTCPFESVLEWAQVECESGPKSALLDNNFSFLLQLERHLHLPAYFLVALTSYGRNLIRNNRWFPGSFVAARNHRELYCYVTDMRHSPMRLLQQVPVYVGTCLEHQEGINTGDALKQSVQFIIPTAEAMSDVTRLQDRYKEQLDSLDFAEVQRSLACFADMMSRVLCEGLRPDILFFYDGRCQEDIVVVDTLREWFKANLSELAEWVLP